MLYKNLPRGQLIWKLPLRLVLDSITAWKSLLTGNTIYFAAIWNAHLGFINWCLFKQQESVMPVNRGTVLKGWFKGSIVWAYFVRGKTKFSEIMRSEPV